MSVKSNLFSRLTRTRLLFPLLLIVLLLPAVYWYTTRPKETAAWWNESWVYRKRIDISNPGGSDLTDFQVSFTLDTTDTSKFQSNCEDLRITGVDGNLLPFWIEENNPGCGNASTKVWVKLPSIPSSGTYIYAYYGNPSASVSSDHDGEKVFEFFDDFSDNSLDTNKWEDWTTDSNTTSYTISNGEIQLTGQCNTGIKTKTYSGENYRVIARTKDNADSGLILRVADNDHLYLVRTNMSGYATDYFIRNGSWTGLGGGYTNFGVWTDWRIVEFSANGSSLSSKVDGTQLNTVTNTTFTSGGIGLRRCSGSPYFDWVFVQKFTSTNPTTSTQSEETGPGPIAYWKFDEGTGSTVNDSSSNAHHGTISGATWQTEDQCVSGKCIYFDGTNDYIDTNWDFDMGSDISTSFSIWIKPVTVDTGGKVKTILGKIDYQYALYQLDQKLYFQAWTSAGVNTIAYQTNNILNTNQWTQVTFIHNGSEHKSYFYINGTLYGSANDTAGTFKNVSESMKIGRGYGWGGSTTPYFNGFIDELKVFPYARTADQTLQDYNQYANSIGDESSSLSNGLVGYWKMDEASWNGTSNEVIDSSGNNNHATSAYGANVTTGKYGNAGNFDGTDDQVDTTATNLYPYTNNFTISAWVKPTTLAHARIAGHAGTAKGFGLGIRSTGAIWLVTQSVKDYVTTTTPITTNSWQLLTAVMDSNNDVSFYLNGTFIEKVTHTSPAVANTDTVFRIGQWNSTYKFTGSIDEVRVYNRALSASEVSSLYHYAPGPVGYWKLDEAQGTTANDSSGYGHTGTLTNSPTWTTGKLGGALSFNGAGSNNQEIQINDTNTLDLTGNLTAQAWVKWNSFKNYGVVIEKGSGGSANTFNYAIWSYNDRVHGFIANGSGNNGVSYSSSNISLNVWHHVAIVADGTKLRMYFDGQEVASTNQTITPYANTYPLRITYSGYTIDGYIDEVKLYNYARTVEQIRQDMAGTSNPNTSSGSILPQPILHWKLDEGKGTTVNDSSSNNYTGTIGCAGTGCTLPTWKNDGKINKAVYFYDVDPNRIYITRSPINISSTTGSKMTWTTWIKPNATQNGGGWFLRNGNGTDQNYGLNLGTLSNGYYRLSFTGYDTTFRTITTTNYIVPASQWSHLAVTYSQGEWIKIYVNGEFKEQVTWSYSPTVQSTSEFAIGGHQGSTGQRFNGYLDEFKVYNSELTINQVKQDMNSGSTLAVGTTTSEAADLSDGEGNPPIAEWKLDEAQGGTAYDTSGNNYNGTITGATWNAWCKYGGCLQFNGNEYVDLGNNKLSIIGNVTLSAWINTSSSADGGIVSKYANHSYWTYRLYMDTNGKAVFNRGYDGSWTTSVTSNTSINDGQWHHLSAVFDGTNMIIYIDGAKDNSVAENRNSDPTNIWNLCIGSDYYNCSSSNGVGKFTGRIDHIKIYNYARTPAQIAYDYNRGEPIAHWKMDECQGSTINDASGNNNQGTLTIGGSGSQTSIGSCPTSGAWGNGSSGKFNSSISLDGTDDYISFGDVLDMGTSDWSVSSWFKTSSPTGAIVGKSLYGNATGRWSIAYDQNVLKVIFQSASLNGTFSIPGTWHDNSWHNVVVTFDRSGYAKAYIDGNFISQNSIAASVNDDQQSSCPVYVGAYQNSTCTGTQSGYFFAGQIDNVEIYNYVLSETQIQKVMNEGSSLRFGE